MPPGRLPAWPGQQPATGKRQQPVVQGRLQDRTRLFRGPAKPRVPHQRDETGYTAALACQVEISGGSAPANEIDWLSGCVDALCDLGFKR